MRAVFRPMQHTDLATVMEIETIAYPFPWTLQNFKDRLRTGYIAKVLELDNELTGYGIMSVAADEAQILNICVHPNQQRRGYGQQILKHLLELASFQAAKSVFLEVRISNQAAINLYHKNGFNQIALCKGYYPNDNKGREDALIFALEI